MIVKELSLRNYRNYEKMEIQLNPGMNIITGQNAQGKTNLLESLVYLSLTRSHRITKDEQLIRHDCQFAQIQATVEDDDKTKKLDVIIHDHGRGKTLRINRGVIKKSSEFVGQLNVVLFSPDDMGIYNDAPRIRRRIMNQEISKVSPKYLIAMNRYKNLLKERNTLLKRPRIDQAYLDILDEQMIQAQLIVIRAQRAFVQSINESLDHYYKYLSDDTIHASLRLISCVDEDDIQTGLENMYRRNRQRDLEMHVTSNGVHKDDLIFELNHQNVIYCASQGQKRMMMLSFKMSILDFIRNVTGKSAILLLDDVLSELDLNRQKKLIELVKNPYQCVITSAVIPEFLKYENTTIFTVENGMITNGGSE